MVKEDDEPKSSVKQIQHRSTDFMRWIIVPVGEQGGFTLSYVCPHCHRSPLEDYTWWG